jgi:aspartokinase/homoserine dehydrogenase 1
LEKEDQVSILAIVGENMKQTPGVSGKIFSALGRNGINVRATAQGSSELNISVVIPTRDLTKALKALHQTFFLSDRKKLHMYLIGPGTIGKTFLRQVETQKDFLREHLNLEIVLTGIANSKKMWISEKGIGLDKWESELVNFGKPSNIEEFVKNIPELNLPNSVLVDCTSGIEVMGYYPLLLRKSIAVVTPNKQANSGSLAAYKKLKESALKGNTRFLYETNVGAGLPVIQTLKNLINSGDEIFRIEAMLSGTLSFIFNSFHSGVSFRSVVEEAKALGYTEPDPRDDLSGKDMARKILILARESGLDLEPEDVETQNILPVACLEAPTIEAFMESLTSENAFFNDLISGAEAEGKKLKFICKLENEKVSIRLEKIGQDHPFWNSSGADNILAFYSARYQKRPLLVQGPGAGAEVTAAGVFGDVISLAI